MKKWLDSFIHKPTTPSILLIVMATLAIIVANTPLDIFYKQLIQSKLTITINQAGISKPILLWINDGLMAVFFMLVGLELKKEFLEGIFTEKKNILLPAAGAIGGMIIPALIYVLFNYNDPTAINGWAIPAATDIAFALGVLALLGPGISTELRVLLTSIAIFDDVGAIIIIALFYTAKVSVLALCIVLVCVLVLYLLNHYNIFSLLPYLFVGLVMWFAMIKSGVHATLAGVLLAFFIPNKSINSDHSPLKNLEKKLSSPVTFFILPVFAFANSGVSLSNFSSDMLLHPVSIGISLGLFLGKQLGVFTFCWAVIKLNITKKPDSINWRSLYGLSLLTGIGFTMSLFIGSLAFEQTGVDLFFDERVGIIVGSLLSGIAGYFVLKKKST